MLISLLSWWYTAGWRDFGKALIDKMKGALSFFSIGSLMRTLFAPFRQISVGEGGDSLEAKMQAFLDRLVSRLVGAVVRIMLMLAGVVVFLVEMVISILLMICWPLVPVLPVICVMLAFTGVTI